MIFQFQIAVIKIKKALKLLVPDMSREEIRNLTQPLHNIAKDVKKLCNHRKRGATKKFFRKHCLPDTEVTDAPGCINSNSITDECLVSEICNIDQNNVGCSDIKRGVRAALVDAKDFFSSIPGRIVLPDDSILDLKRADDLCCNAECQAAWCPFWKIAEMEFELTMQGVDLGGYIANSNAEQLENLGQQICESKCAIDGAWPPENCKAEFYQSQINRRLLDSTTSIGVRIIVNSTDPAPLSCETDGSLEGFDAVVSETNPNITSVSRLNTGSCNCTVGMCDEPDYSEPTDGPVSSEGSEGSMDSGSPSNSTDQSSVNTNYSASFSTILLLFLFAKNASDL